MCKIKVRFASVLACLEYLVYCLFMCLFHSTFIQHSYNSIEVGNPSQRAERLSWNAPSHTISQHRNSSDLPHSQPLLPTSTLILSSGKIIGAADYPLGYIHNII